MAGAGHVEIVRNPTSVKVAAACLAHLGNAKTWAQLFGDPEKLGVLPRYFRSCRGFWHVGDVGMLLHACVNPMPDLRMLVKFLPDVV